ncbi:hypothetical protein F1B59_21725 [Escherichia coli]|nr:hypothetical protein [Escherichia coli]
MMTKYDKERFNKRISDEVQISADIRINDFMTESAAYITITEPSLYKRSELILKTKKRPAVNLLQI